MNPKVSIITASYNYANIIEKGIKSIINQTYDNWELIIVDDGSTDNSLEIIEKYTENPKIKLYKHEGGINKGLKETLLLGLKYSKGSYMAFLEADDWWENNYLEEKIEVIKKYPNIKFIFNDVSLFSNQKNIDLSWYNSYLKSQKKILRKLKMPCNCSKYFVKHNFIPTFSCVLVEKEILVNCNFDTPVDATVDYWLFQQIASETELYYINKKLTHWMMHQDSYIRTIFKPKDTFNGFLTEKKPAKKSTNSKSKTRSSSLKKIIKKIKFKTAYSLKGIKKHAYKQLKIVNAKEFDRVNAQNKNFVNMFYQKNPNIHSKDYIEKSSHSFQRQKDDVKIIAFYLPQFHAIPENNKWWGNGFTEWTNVTKAQPQFVGHYQPQLPDELGFYDLSKEKVMPKQIELAKKYGIYGFCFHYYWFSGKRLLEKPLFDFLGNKDLDFPFMLCWPNESWTRAWTCLEGKILIDQEFKEEDYLKFIQDIMPFFKDERYIKIDNKPVFIVYRPHFFPKDKLIDAIEVWRNYVKKEGFDDLYILNTRTGGFKDDPREWGMDATVEFPPNDMIKVSQNKKDLKILNPDFDGYIFNLHKSIAKTEKLPPVNYTLYKSVFPSWDNTARKNERGSIFYGSSPEFYKKWLLNCIDYTKEHFDKKNQFLFVNAWNEWAEGAHLEPDRKYGFAYLEATLDALKESRNVEYELGDYYSLNQPQKINDVQLKNKRKSKIKNPYVYMFLKSKGNIKRFLINKKGYKAIKDLDLFDESYYVNKYPNIKSSGMDPLLHYMFFGYKEGKLPSANFDGKYYLKKYRNVASSGMNPLIHYSLYGINEGKKTIDTINRVKLKDFDDIVYESYPNNQINDILKALNPYKKISVIVPIYNAFEDLELCISSVLEKTKIPYELILIDDASTDSRIEDLLVKLEKIPHIKVVRNKENRGFVHNVNIGIKRSKGDVVLLNSDTIVTDRWLQKLVIAAYSNEQVGTVTPFSNAAGVFSVPVSGKNNDIPMGLTIDSMAKLVERVSSPEYPEVPTANGFCMFIKRNTIIDTGLFDEEHFGKGYGEENDFCMRASKLGWKHIVDDSTFIYHKRSASFSNEKNELMKKHSQVISELYPEYDELVQEFVKSEIFENLRNNVKTELNNPQESILKNKKRILFVIFNGGGGTPQTNMDLMKHLQPEYECFVLLAEPKCMYLKKVSKDGLVDIESYSLKSKWNNKKTHLSEYKQIYFNVLVNYKIDLVHIRHLLWHTLDIVPVCNRLSLPVIISFHDFYHLCPSIHLINEDDVYCELKCLENEKCINWINFWRKEISNMLLQCDALVTTTEYTKNTYLKVYRHLKGAKFNIVEHGRDFPIFGDKDSFMTVPEQNSPIKILIPGHIVAHKGSEFIKSLKSYDKENKLELHFCGTIDDDLKDLGIYHGKYLREELFDHVRKIKPSFMGIFSAVPETYSHTLSEAWACGLPVLVSKMGALESRLNENGGGWFLDIYNPKEAYEEIIRISKNKKEYLKVKEQVCNIKIKSISEMAEDYKDLYEEVLHSSSLNLMNNSQDISDEYKKNIDGLYAPKSQSTKV